jgi:hypothetical protein
MTSLDQIKEDLLANKREYRLPAEVYERAVVRPAILLITRLRELAIHCQYEEVFLDLKLCADRFERYKDVVGLQQYLDQVLKLKRPTSGAEVGTGLRAISYLMHLLPADQRPDEVYAASEFVRNLDFERTKSD